MQSARIMPPSTHGEHLQSDEKNGDNYGTQVEVAEPLDLATQRFIKARQMSMIAIGGAIGTGLIIGSGSSLARSGPGSLFLSYLVMGTVCFGVMCALGEMSTRFPTKKGFAGHASRCVNSAFGFVTALVYLCKYLILSPAQIIAFSLVIRYWNTSINSAAWVSILVVFVFAINLLGVKWFSETEFWLCLIKIVALTGLILLALIIDLGGVPGQPRIGFAYWQDGKAFKPYVASGDFGRFLGFLNAMVLALFAFMGCEIVGVTVGEAKNPRKSVPAAIRKTFFRIAFFYILGVLVVGMAVDSSSPLLAQANALGTAGGASASPFVVAVVAAGVKVVPSVANASILVFTISAANADQYIASRTLYGMARDGHAPRFFTRCTKRGVMIAAFSFTGPFMLLAFLVSSENSLTVFNYFSSAVTMFGGITWICILSSHIAFQRGMKAQNISRNKLPWKAPFQPYLSYFSLGVTCFVCLFKGFDSFTPWSYKTFITHYIGLAVFVCGYFGYKFLYKIRTPSPTVLDLTSESSEFEDVDEESHNHDVYNAMSVKEKTIHYIKNW